MHGSLHAHLASPASERSKLASGGSDRLPAHTWGDFKHYQCLKGSFLQYGYFPGHTELTIENIKQTVPPFT